MTSREPSPPPLYPRLIVVGFSQLRSVSCDRGSEWHFINVALPNFVSFFICVVCVDVLCKHVNVRVLAVVQGKEDARRIPQNISSSLFLSSCFALERWNVAFSPAPPPGRLDVDRKATVYGGDGSRQTASGKEAATAGGRRGRAPGKKQSPTPRVCGLDFKGVGRGQVAIIHELSFVLPQHTLTADLRNHLHAKMIKRNRITCSVNATDISGNR